jgi:hypothetical protein
LRGDTVADSEGSDPDRYRTYEFSQVTQADCLANILHCERSLSQNRGVDFYGTIFVCIATFR